MITSFLKKCRQLRIFALFILTTGCHINGQISITSNVTGGWFGDNAIQYIKGKWLAYKYGLTFYFQPFRGGDLLTASSLENMYSNTTHQLFSRRINVKHESDIANNMRDGTLFILEPYAPGFGFHTEDLINYLLLNSPQDFIDSIKPLLQPQKTVALPPIPSHLITVAVHIRKPLINDYPLYSEQEFDTSGYNLTYEIMHLTKNQSIQNRFIQKPKITPINLMYIDIHGHEGSKSIYADVHEHEGSMKFPPNQFYIDQIKKLSEFLNDTPIYVQLFSSNTDQKELYEIIKKGVNKNNISYGPEIGNWDSSLVEDYYAISQFDCLIKSKSSFSSVSQLLGNHAISIVPCEYFWQDRKLILNKSIWLIRDAELNRIKTKKGGQTK